MRTFFLAAFALAPLYAQEGARPLTLPSAMEPTAPIAAPAATPKAGEASLPEGEQRIRAGIVLLGMLHNAMAKVKDHDTAEAAVPVIMRISNELQNWGQMMNNLPPLDEATQSAYEKRYMPIIMKINERLQVQSERIAAAEYYGSQNLPAALVRLVSSIQ